MRIVTLSGHPGGRLAAARGARESAQARADERYQRELAACQERIGQARELRSQALARGRVLSWLRWALEVRHRRRDGPPRRPVPLRPSRDEEILKDGVGGGRQAADELGRALDDGWVMLRGYSNRGGEVDCLLLGPAGLFAIEVKHVNGTFRITPGSWQRVRSDRFGNPREPGVVEDDRGRPPDVQLTEPVRLLEGFLARRGQPARVQPFVLLSHPRARIGHLAPGLAVRVLTSTAPLLREILAAGTELSGTRIAGIERLIVADHRFHAARHRG